MRKNLPSLSALYAFEATARHLSFSRAAIELNLTQGAISQRIRALEEFLGDKLFVRENNTIRLTETAHEYLRSTRNVITEIMVATDRAIGRHRGDELTIGCLGTFAIKCLIPLLPSYRKSYPDVAVRLRTLVPFGNALHEDYDVSIHYGLGDWPGMATWKINDEEVFPVCSPGLLRGAHALRVPGDLRYHTRIHTSSPLILRDDWPLWLEEAGIPQISAANEISCDLLYPSFQMAIEGMGVVMGRSAVVKSDIAMGRLVEPFAIRLPSPLAYHIVTEEHRAKLPKVKSFVDWLLREFKQTMSEVPRSRSR
jgi:LysR family glycine cleavage system transcriptional activator